MENEEQNKTLNKNRYIFMFVCSFARQSWQLLIDKKLMQRPKNGRQYVPSLLSSCWFLEWESCNVGLLSPLWTVHCDCFAWFGVRCFRLSKQIYFMVWASVRVSDCSLPHWKAVTIAFAPAIAMRGGTRTQVVYRFVSYLDFIILLYSLFLSWRFSFSLLQQI